MKQLAMANRLRDAVKTGGLEYNPMMANLADSLLEAAVAGGGMPGSGLPGMPGQTGSRARRAQAARWIPQKRKAAQGPKEGAQEVATLNGSRRNSP